MCISWASFLNEKKKKQQKKNTFDQNMKTDLFSQCLKKKKVWMDEIVFKVRSKDHESMQLHLKSQTPGEVGKKIHTPPPHTHTLLFSDNTLEEQDD